jgi:hypothetical protein
VQTPHSSEYPTKKNQIKQQKNNNYGVKIIIIEKKG